MSKLNTLLRPDYYDYFPLLTHEEVKARLHDLPVHLATFLEPQNLEISSKITGRDERRSFLNTPLENQRRMLGEVLASVGVSPAAAGAVCAVRRERFAPPGADDAAYFNVSIPIADGSCLSAPGLVALMLDQIPQGCIDHVLEVGLGSGYHAACIAEYLGRSAVIFGYEAQGEIGQLGRGNLLGEGYSVTLLDSLSETDTTGQYDLVYATFANRSSRPLRQFVREGGTLQVPRAISEREYLTENEDSWLRTEFSTFDDYVTGNWRNFLCIETVRLIEGADRLLARLYDVTFVPDRLSS